MILFGRKVLYKKILADFFSGKNAQHIVHTLDAEDIDALIFNSLHC